MAASEIEWTECTWNPVAGCRIVSPGCTNCYAMRMAARLEAMGMGKYRGTTRRSGNRSVWSGHINLDEQSLGAPLTWAQPKRIFVNSMSDLFHENVPIAYVERVWTVMQQANWHTFQILTKRPSRMRDLLTSDKFKILPNVWLGTSVESAEYKWRIRELQQTPSLTRFISFEPLIGSVGTVDLTSIHWAIVGGESGPASRRMDPMWVEEIFQACRKQNVAFFFKQWGGKNKKKAGRVLNGRTWDEYPVSDTVRQLNDRSQRAA